VALNLDGRRTSPPTATTKVVFADNLSSTATSATVTDIVVYDSRGGRQVWTATFVRDQSQGAIGEWTVTVKDSNGQTIGTGTLKFIGSVVDPSTSTLTFTDQPDGADPLSVVFDFSTGVTSFSQGTTNTLRAASVDGNGAGNLTTVTIDADGQVKLSYTNQETELAGAVALADFRNPQQLERVGDGLYRNTGGNAQRRLLASGVDGIGTLTPRQLEASNVNLADEFGELILIQRGFQASSQVVSVSNDMIQQLFGIRGQG
jgi:flagellar hook protein FlgE